jgi:hypothetical protein
VRDEGVVDGEQPEDLMDGEQPEDLTDGEQPAPGNAHDDAEVVDGVLVLASARALEAPRESSPPLRAVAVVAATGFVAGAATAAVLGRGLARRQAKRAAVAAAPSQREALEVVASRRFVVHVQTLARR